MTKRKKTPWYGILLVIGILALRNVQVSLQVVQQENPLLHQDIESTTSSSRSYSTTTSAGATSKPFPRWNHPNGIAWSALESYFHYAEKHLSKGHNLLKCPNGGCPPDMPNVWYVFGASEMPQSPANNASSASWNTNPTRKVWVEGRRRKMVGKGFQKRYPIVEELIIKSLEYLLQQWNSTAPEENSAIKNLYPTLYNHLHPDVNDDSKHPNNTLGIPLLFNLGDNRQCHDQNLQWNGKLHSVPVFTLAVPVDCQYAFPIPHPATLDTAKAYGHRWNSIMGYRRKQYPLERQISKAIWRGSPTGYPYDMRYRLVLFANLPNQTTIGSTTTNINSTSQRELPFDVGFGKPLHKIDTGRPVPPDLLPLLQQLSREKKTIQAKTKLWFEDFAKYRMVLDADGSSWSERFAPLLCLNTLVGKLDPDYVDWLWPTLQPYQHFIPLANDSSNLWVIVPYHLQELELDAKNRTFLQRSNTTVSRQIVLRAHDWCQEHLTYPAMVKDFLHALELYAQWLDQGDPNWPAKWHRLVSKGLIPKHHAWQPLPMQRPKPYFPVFDLNISEALDIG